MKSASKGFHLVYIYKRNPQQPSLSADGIVGVTASTTRSITRLRGLTRSWAEDLSSRDPEWSLRRRQRTAQARLCASLSTQVSGRSPVWSRRVVGNARAVNCPGVLGRRGLRESLRERVGPSSCRRMQTLANMAGLDIL